MRIRVKVLKDHPYSKGLKVGDTYEVSGQSQLGLVKAMGWAEEDNTPAPVTPKAMVSPAVVAAKKVPVKRASYLTRDMTAAAPAPLIDNSARAEEHMNRVADDIEAHTRAGLPNAKPADE